MTDANSASWITAAVDKACTNQSAEWNELLNVLTTNCNVALGHSPNADMHVASNHPKKRFSQLSSAEQAAVVESQFFEVNLCIFLISRLKIS
jgi:hypothetical protein